MLLRSRRVHRLPTQGLALGSALLAAAIWRLLGRVEVRGDSMRPTLIPGDRLLTVRWGRVRPGDLVVLADPRRPQRQLVKRVAARSGGDITVVGDNPHHSTDSRAFGPVARVRGRPVYRYHPASRAGRIT